MQHLKFFCRFGWKMPFREVFVSWVPKRRAISTRPQKTRPWPKGRHHRHCCKAHERINRKTGNSTPCKIVTPGNFSSKVCTRDYVGDGNYYANFCENRFSETFSLNRWNTTHLWLFWLSCSVLSFFSRSWAQVQPLDRFSRFMAQTTCFRARKCLLGVTTTDDIIWGKICSQTP